MAKCVCRPVCLALRSMNETAASGEDESLAKKIKKEKEKVRDRERERERERERKCEKERKCW